jgi:predicted secreted hydrolase
MAHFTVTDVNKRRFYAFDRFSRAAQGLAGAKAVPFQVWVDDWRADAIGHDTFPVKLVAQRGGVGLELWLDAGKPIVLEGDGGISRKGPELGNASYYYSLPRMPTRGVLTLDGERIPVEGRSWMDREWGTSQLSRDQIGWDWFSLQLSDGNELMYYRLRDRSGQVDPFSHGTWIQPDGASIPLTPGEVDLKELGSWTSPHSHLRYPSGWAIQVPHEGLSLTVTPWLEDQELNLSIRYWEGASRIDGTHQGRPVEGLGYVELTGYETRPEP